MDIMESIHLHYLERKKGPGFSWLVLFVQPRDEGKTEKWFNQPDPGKSPNMIKTTGVLAIKFMKYL